MTFFEWAMAATPAPDPNFNPDSVTPQWIGFLATFLVAVATVLLVLDMTRRIRRVRYRDEIRMTLEAERAAADLGGADPGNFGGGAVGGGAVDPSAADGPGAADDPADPGDPDNRGGAH
ncbi:MAG: hypothetical protein QOG18_734 [Microbacteriaceae bacterium]|jgi:hypothetical protein|nr:hypothetical protein [Microbacteriaceae bacterium]